MNGNYKQRNGTTIRGDHRRRQPIDRRQTGFFGPHRIINRPGENMEVSEQWLSDLEAELLDPLREGTPFLD